MRPVEVTWHNTDTWWGHASPRGCLRGVNSDIICSRLNRTLGKCWRDTWLHEDSSMKIGWLKSRRVESASWATIPAISRDRTAEITHSGICIMGHNPTDFAQSDGWNHTEWNPHYRQRSRQFCTNFSINRCSLPFKLNSSLIVKQLSNFEGISWVHHNSLAF